MASSKTRGDPEEPRKKLVYPLVNVYIAIENSVPSIIY